MVSEIGSQMSEVRRQMSDVRKLGDFNQKRSWVLDHRTEHRTNSLTFFYKVAVLFFAEILTVLGKIQPSIRLTVFSISPSCMLYEQEAASVSLLIK